MTPEDKKYILENVGKKSVKRMAEELRLRERVIRNFLERERVPLHRASPAASAAVTSVSADKRFVALSVALIVLMGFIAYGNSLGGKFMLDDSALVADNFYVKKLPNAARVFVEDIGKGAGRVSNFYRPLQIFTYALDYAVWGLNVTGYHLTNTLLHIFVALSIYRLILLLYGDGILSLFTSVLFVVHPVQTEAVSYISGRADPLAALFIMLSLILYVKYISSSKIGCYIPMLGCYILSLLSREGALVFPLLIILYHYAFKKKFRIEAYTPILFVTCAYILIRVTVLRSSLPPPMPTTLLQRLPGSFAALATYVRLLLLPFDLHMEYGIRLFSMADPRAIAGLIAFLIMSYAAFTARNKNSLVFFSISWFMVCLLPVANLYPINAYMAEHWLYLPSIGFFLLLSKFLTSIYRIKAFKLLAVATVTALAFFYSALAIMQNGYWKDPMAFYKRTVRYAPDSYLMQNNLGNAHKEAGRHAEALRSYEKSIQLNPKYVEAYINLGSAYNDAGRKEDAIKAFKAAIQIDSINYAHAYINLGIVYASIGRYREAMDSYKKAIEISPNLAYAYSSLGMTYLAMGNKEEAIALCQKAVEINPNYPNSYNNLGSAYIYAGKTEEAIAAYKKATMLNPAYDTAYYNLGVVLNSAGRNEEAVEAYKKAIAIAPQYAMPYNNLALTYYRLGQYGLALSNCDTARKLGYKVDPAFAAMLEQYRARK